MSRMPSHHSTTRPTGLGLWLYLFLASAGGAALVLVPLPWAVPVLQALLAYPVLRRDLRESRPWSGVFHMLLWALLLSVMVILLTLLLPARVEMGVLRGAAYREEMFTWIRTGVGAESTPGLFIPQHAGHYALTLLLSMASAGLAGLALGAVLLNYMNFYVGSLIGEAVRPGLAAIFGWPVWSLVRVAGFVVGSVAVAQITVSSLRARRFSWSPEIRRMLVLSLALVVADIAIKAALAPTWRRILARAFLSQ